MQPYQPVAYRHPALRQAAAPAAPAPVAPAPAPAVSDATKKIVTGGLTLAVLASAAWAGFYAGSKTHGIKRVAGYVGGIGAGLLGAAVIGNAISVPAITQTAQMPFNLQVAP
jgi:hypothetical protein